MSHLALVLQGILLVRGGSVKARELTKLLNCTDDELQAAVATLTTQLTGSALTLIETDTELQLVLTPDISAAVQACLQTELQSDIGKAGAETLGIIAYRGPTTKATIDHIRGVNSQTALRSLLVRGLIRKEGSGATTTFSVTAELLRELGVTHRHELPAFVQLMEHIEEFEKRAV